jgi:hypothetical protein
MFTVHPVVTTVHYRTLQQRPPGALAASGVARVQCRRSAGAPRTARGLIGRWLTVRPGSKNISSFYQIQEITI